ncbi:MAG: hypothetical protein E7449_01120 [Ruminococcaceae bacterium]|nr:hypothetical protein [Oscillospiraceae bacterium]
MTVEKAKAFDLPDGAYVKVETCDGDVWAFQGDTRKWAALDVTLVRADGTEEVLCSIDYEDGRGLFTLVFDDTHETPIFKHQTEIKKETTHEAEN